MRWAHNLADAPDWRLTLHDTANYLRAQVATRIRGVYCPSLFVHYGVNSACNLRCWYCFIHEPETFPLGFSEVGLPLDQAKRVLEHSRQEAMFLRFMGGEPLIYPHLTELAGYAKRQLRFRNVSVITNGLVFMRQSEAWCDALLDTLDIVTISFDETRTRQYPKEMAALTEFLPELKARCDRHKVGLTMNYTATAEELAEPSRIDDFVRRHRAWFPYVYVVPVRTVGRTPLPVLRAAQRLMRTYSLGFYGGADYPEQENVAWYQKHCNPKLKVKIMADGGLLAPCENYSGTVGSVVTHRIRDLWKGPLTQFPNQSCVGCGKQRFRLEAFKRTDRQMLFLWKRSRGSLKGIRRTEASPTPLVLSSTQPKEASHGKRWNHGRLVARGRWSRGDGECEVRRVRRLSRQTAGGAPHRGLRARDHAAARG